MPAAPATADFTPDAPSQTADFTPDKPAPEASSGWWPNFADSMVKTTTATPAPTAEVPDFTPDAPVSDFTPDAQVPMAQQPESMWRPAAEDAYNHSIYGKDFDGMAKTWDAGAALLKGGWEAVKGAGRIGARVVQRGVQPAMDYAYGVQDTPEGKQAVADSSPWDSSRQTAVDVAESAMRGVESNMGIVAGAAGTASDIGDALENFGGEGKPFDPAEHKERYMQDWRARRMDAEKAADYDAVQHLPKIVTDIIGKTPDLANARDLQMFTDPSMYLPGALAKLGKLGAAAKAADLLAAVDKTSKLGAVLEATGRGMSAVGHSPEALAAKMGGDRAASVVAHAMGTGGIVSLATHGIDFTNPFTGILQLFGAAKVGGATVLKAGEVASAVLPNIGWKTAQPMFQSVAKNEAYVPWLRDAFGKLAANHPALDTFVTNLGDIGRAGVHGAATNLALGLASGQSLEQASEGAGFGFGLAAGLHGIKGAVHGDVMRQAADTARLVLDLKRQHADMGMPDAQSDAIINNIDPEVQRQMAAMNQVFGGKLFEQGASGGNVVLRLGDDFRANAPADKKGTAGYYDPVTRQIVINVESKLGAGQVFLHEIGHSLYNSVLNQAQWKAHVDSRLSEGDLEASGNSYAAKIAENQVRREMTQNSKVPPTTEQVNNALTQARIDATRASLDADAGGTNKWIYEELYAEQTQNTLFGKNIRSDVLKPDEYGVDRAVGITDPNFARRALSLLFPPEMSQQVARGLKPKQIFENFPAFDSPVGRRMVYEAVRERNRTINELTKPDTGDTGTVSNKEIAAAGAEGHAMRYNDKTGKAENDFFEGEVPITGAQPKPGEIVKGAVNVREKNKATINRTDKTRQQEVAANIINAKINDPNAVTARRGDDGRVAVTGTQIAPQIANFQTLSPHTKNTAAQIDQAIASGQMVKVHYQTIASGSEGSSYNADLRRNKGNKIVTERNVYPYNYTVSSRGNILVKVVDMTTARRRALDWADTGKISSKEGFNNDPGAFMDSVIQLLKNHAKGLPGDSNGVTATQKKTINAFLAGDIKGAREFNPTRAALRGSDRKGIIRDFRLDRIANSEPSQQGQPIGGRIDYGKIRRNASPDVQASPDGHTLNVGLSVKDGSKVDPEEAIRAIESTGAKTITNPMGTQVQDITQPGQEGRRIRATPDIGTGWIDPNGKYSPNQGELHEDAIQRLMRGGDYKTALQRGWLRTVGSRGTAVTHIDNGGKPLNLTPAQKILLEDHSFENKTVIHDTPAGGRTIYKAVPPPDRSAYASPDISETVKNPKFQEWFNGSKVVDENGQPRVMYHATQAPEFSSFKRRRNDLGMHFGTEGQANDRLEFKSTRGDSSSEGARSIPVFLNIKNPLRLPDTGAWDLNNLFRSLKNAGFSVEAMRDVMLGRSHDTSRLAGLRDLIEQSGYDGVVYKNTGETSGAAEQHAAVDAARARVRESQKQRGKSTYSFDREDQQTPEYTAYRAADDALSKFREDNAEDSYIVFHPTQVKSALGNSGEFNKRSGNMMASPDISETVKNPKFQEWFRGSKIVDENGQPRVMYHGTDAPAFNKFAHTNDIGFHFGSEDAANARLEMLSSEKEGEIPYPERSNTYPVFLNLKNPLRLPDLNDWGPRAVLDSLKKAGIRLPPGDDHVVDRNFVKRVLNRNGYDSIVYENALESGETPSDSYIALDANQIKSATGNSGEFSKKTGNMMASPDFYSKLEELIEKKGPNAARPDQFKGMIAGAGLKAEELKWSKVNEFLDSKKGEKVTKQELLDYLRGPGSTKFEETAYGAGSKANLEELLRTEEAARNNLNALVKERANILAERHYYVESRLNEVNDQGARDLEYRERATDPKLQQIDDRKQTVVALIQNASLAHSRAFHAYQDMKEGAGAKYDKPDLVLPGGENYYENIVSMAKESRPKSDVYTSGHFPDAGDYVSHYRADERADAEGRKGTFVQEIQADRHQDAQKHGYKRDRSELTPEERKTQERLHDGLTAVVEAYNARIQEVRTRARTAADDAFFHDNSDKRVELTDNLNELYEKEHPHGISDAPYRKDWPVQTFKRALRDAISKGHEWVGWTDGQTQADRYNQTYPVEAVGWSRDDNGEKNVTLTLKKDGPSGSRYVELVVGPDGKITNVENFDGLVGHDLSEVIGREQAAKLLADKGRDGYYEANDLTVGGEGIKYFYDRILPTEIGKYVKPYGAKVEPTSDGKNDYWKVDITPQMRESIQQKGQPLFSPDMEIPTRVPSNKPVTNDPGSIIDAEVLKNPTVLFKAAAKLREDKQLVLPGADKMDDAQLVDAFVNHAAGNLEWIYDKVPEATRMRSKLWYDGAHEMTKQIAKEDGLSHESVAAVIAALSPQKDWFINASLGRRVVDTWMKQQDSVAPPEFKETLARLQIPNAVQKKAGILHNADLAKYYENIKGKTLREIADPIEKAAFVRLWDETYNDRTHQAFDPENNQLGIRMKTVKGKLVQSGTEWGSLPEIAKAVSVLEDPSHANISKQMGRAHKVRSFYNNLISPNSRAGHVAVDTHAVGAARLEAVGSKTKVVTNSFSGFSHNATGMEGLYPLYAEAYRRAAENISKREGIKILPREVQSITWEAAHGLFPKPWKTEKNKKAVQALWQDYSNGKATLDETRNKIHDYAGGIRPPEWERGRPDAQLDEKERGGNQPGQLYPDGLHGQPAGGVGPGAGSPTAEGPAGSGQDPRTAGSTPARGVFPRPVKRKMKTPAPYAWRRRFTRGDGNDTVYPAISGV